MQSQQQFRTVVPRTIGGKDDGCCSIDFLKAALYVFNCFFWCSGLTIGALGIYTIIMKYDFVYVLPSNLYMIITYMLLGICGTIILIGILGCWATVTDRRCGLYFFAVCLIIILLAEASCGILAYYYDMKIENRLSSQLSDSMTTSYFIDQKKFSAVNKLQEQFKCCGATKYSDWNKVFEEKRRDDGTFLNLVPDSCCITIIKNCGKDTHPSNIHHDGCFSKLAQYIKDHLLVIIGIGLGICLLQVIGITFACVLAQKLGKYQSVPNSSNFKNQPNEWMLH